MSNLENTFALCGLVWGFSFGMGFFFFGGKECVGWAFEGGLVAFGFVFIE